MRTILCYGDSNTHGHATDARPDGRFGPNVRWPGVLREKLGSSWLVIEEGLGGRTTVSDDPVEGLDKNGRTYLHPCLASHRPLDVVIVMLGTNDLKIRFNKPASEIARGGGALVQDIMDMRPGPGDSIPEIIVVSPPPVLEDLKGWASMFEGARNKSLHLAEEFALIANTMGVHFFDAGSVATSSEVDGFHLDATAHGLLGNALANEVVRIT